MFAAGLAPNSVLPVVPHGSGALGETPGGWLIANYAMTLYRNGKGSGSGQNAPSLDTYDPALAQDLSSMVIDRTCVESEPQLDQGSQPQRARAAKQHTRVADVLRPSLEPHGAVQFPVIDPKMQREAPSTGWGFRCDFHGRWIDRET